MKTKKNNNAFTLIELLVVVLLLGVLVTIATVEIMGAQARGRDAKRKSDLAEMYKAVANYSIANSGDVPKAYENTTSSEAINTLGFASCSPTAYSHDWSGSWSHIESLLRTYLNNGTLPTDPTGKCTGALPNDAPKSKQNGHDYYYADDPVINKFVIATYLENEDDPDRNGANEKYKYIWGYNSKRESAGSYLCKNEGSAQHQDSAGVYAVGSQIDIVNGAGTEYLKDAASCSGISY